MPTPAIDFAKDLNPQQHAAATHGDGPQLVIAGAGSGKTRVITYRIAWLVQERDVDPRAISAVTFTNKAAQEMKVRVEGLIGVYPLPAFVGTFHRFALGLLRRWGDRVGLERDFAILDSSDQKSLVKKALALEGVDESSFQPQVVLSAISGAKNRLLDPAAYEKEADGFFRKKVAGIYRAYQKQLMLAGGIDFDDMIRLSVRLLDREKDVRRRVRACNRYLMVDEFQDTNYAQLRLIHALVDNDGNLTAVGDEDQGIYRWRGAELDNILRFERNFPGAEVRKLERNYRSTQTILDASGALVAHNEGRRGKELWTEAGDGEPLILYRARDEIDEARWIVRALQGLGPDIGYGQSGVLVRTNAQTRALEDALLERRVPYSLIGGLRFYERAEVKDVIAYLRLLRNPRDTLSLNRVLNRPTRGIGRTTHDKLLRRAGELDKNPWDVLVEEHLDGIPHRGAKALVTFRDLIRELSEELEARPLPSLLRHLLETTDYPSMYAKDTPENQAKRENIAELLSAAQEFTEKHGYGSDLDDLLVAFLDHVSLVADIDGLEVGKGVSLMTLHSAKGLEFPAVIVAGLEDGILPHFNAQAHQDDVEEERRLLYVGMTRAEQRLMLTTCRRRRVAGRYQDQSPSPFLEEIPARFMTVEESPEIYDRGFGGGDGSGSRPDAGASSGSGSANSVYAFFGGGAASQESPPFESPTTHASPSRPSPARSASNQSGDLKRGCRVRHAKLGRGVLLKIEGSGDETRWIVYFEDHGRRKLLARFAKLKVL